MSQNDRMTHDDDRYREDVRITRDESSGTANIMTRPYPLRNWCHVSLRMIAQIRIVSS